MRLTPRGRFVLSLVLIVGLTFSVMGAWQLAGEFSGADSAAVLGVTPSATPTPQGESDVVVRPTPTPTKAQPKRSATATRTATNRRSTTSSRQLVVVPGSGRVVGHGPVHRFKVEVESGIGERGPAFAAAVERTLGDSRSWGKNKSFKRVSSGSVAFTVTLASPSTTDRLCAPLRTGGIYSCYSRGRSVINVNRWQDGARTYAGHLAEYRHYVVSHEVGHAFGRDHTNACRADGLASVMMQQTKSLYGCKRNPWPYP